LKEDTLSPHERRIIDIFNSYKKGRLSTRNRKLNLIHQKRLLKKKFFEVKKSQDTTMIHTQENEIRENQQNLSKHLEPTLVDSVENSPRSAFPQSLQFLRNIQEISKSNLIFFSALENNKTFNYESDVRILKSLLNQMKGYFTK
jgi:hypothetical protein